MQRGLSTPSALVLACFSVSACTSSSTPEPGAPLALRQPSSSRFELVGVATWRGNASAAYSIIHDDICDDNADGALSIGSAQLKRHGLHAGFGVIGSKCTVAKTNQNKWPLVKNLVADGNDVFSHSWSHPCIDGNASRPPDECPPDAVYSSDMEVEIGKAGDELKTQLGVSPDFFIFPYDYCSPRAIAYLKAKGYLGARCGASDGVPANPPAFADPFLALYDVFGPAYSYYWNDGACKGKISQFKTDPYEVAGAPKGASAPAACVTHVLQQYVDDTIAAKGWGIRELHGFHGTEDKAGSFEPIAETDYAAHLDYIKGKQDSGALWVEGPTPVLRYRVARTACATPTIATGNTLHFVEPNADCKKYATTLSYLISSADANDAANLQVLQDGKLLAVKKLGQGRFVVDADPTAGDAVLIQ